MLSSSFCTTGAGSSQSTFPGRIPDRRLPFRVLKLSFRQFLEALTHLLRKLFRGGARLDLFRERVVQLGKTFRIDGVEGHRVVELFPASFETGKSGGKSIENVLSSLTFMPAMAWENPGKSVASSIKIHAFRRP